MLAVLVVSLPTTDRRTFPPPILPPPGGPPMGLPLAGLDLTDAQVESIHNRRAEFAEKIDPLMSQLHSKRAKRSNSCCDRM